MKSAARRSSRPRSGLPSTADLADPRWRRFEKQLGIGVNGTTPDGLFSVEAVRCIGCCGLAPAVVVNGEVHGKLTAKDVASVIAKYRELG